jgi:hypothetical protein
MSIIDVLTRTLAAGACLSLDHLLTDLGYDAAAALEGFDFAANGLRRPKVQQQVRAWHRG